MAFPIQTNLQFNNGAQALGFRLETTGTAPSSNLSQGQLYYNSTDDKIYKRTASAWVDVATGGGSGSVTSVDMTVPSILAVSGNPITTTGTLAVTLATQNANLMFAGPSSGGAAVPTFRSIVQNDLPSSVPISFWGTATAAINMGGFKVTNAADGSAATDLVTFQQLTNMVAGQKTTSTRGATVSALAITARTSTTLTLGGVSFSHDGVTYANGETITVKNSTTGTGSGTHDNGKYTVSGVGSSIVLTRTADMDTAAETDGHFVLIQDGTVNVGKMFAMTVEVATLGTDPITWTEVNKATDLVAGNGLTLTGLTLAVTNADGSITVGGDTVSVALSATPGLELSTGLRIKSDTVTANTIGITLTANGAGVKYDSQSFGESAEALTLNTAVAGAGMTMTSGVINVISSNGAIVANANDIALTLATNSGLSVTGGLNIASDTVTANTIGVTSTANGAGVKFNSTSFADGGAETLALASGVAGAGLTLTTGVLSVTSYTPVASSTVARVRVFAATSIGSGTPVTVTHNLNTQGVSVTVMDSTTKVAQMVDWDANGVNTCRITALGSNYNADIIVIG